MSDLHGSPSRQGTFSAQHSLPLIVTGANHRYARTLVQFLLSAERHGEHRRFRWVVFDLGLAAADRRLIGRRFPWAHLRGVSFADYPPHVEVGTGSFAWKPILLLEAAQGHAGPVFWFDSATVLRRGLDAPLATIARTGLWTLRGQTPLMGRADARVIAALSAPAEILHLPERVAGAVGFDTRHTVAAGLFAIWAALARDPRFILPKDPDPAHRFDQTLLSVLLLAAEARGDVELGDEEVDISSVRPVGYLTTRNKLWPGLPLWLDAPARGWYRAWKAGDRMAHRLRIFDDTRIDGWRRQRREHFSVRLRDVATGRETPVPGPAGGYYADPFLWRKDGHDFLFVEEFVYARDRGHLAVLSLDAGHAVASAAPLEFLPDHAAIACHASFPFIFAHDGQTYMIPETHERRTVDLFVCERWPARWRLVRRLLSGIDAVDTMALREGGRWYLLTSAKGAWPNRHLEIHHADDLLSGCFLPHPVNNTGVYGNNAFGTGRNAGLITRNHDGALMRLMQQSTSFYGESLQPMHVTTLTPEHFAETPALSIDCLPGFAAPFPSHHASRAGDVIAYDTRDRAK